MAVPATLVNVTADAVMQAYNDYDGGAPVVTPDGYASPGTSLYAWEGLDPDSPAIAKKFAMVFRSNTSPGSFLVAIRGTETPDEWIANAAIAAAVPDSIRIFNRRDIVPFLPPTENGFVSTGTDWPLEFYPLTIFDRVLPDALKTNHSIGNYGYVTGHAALNNPQSWVGTFADLSTDTTWSMQSAVASAGNPLGAELAQARVDFLKQLRKIHGL